MASFYFQYFARLYEVKELHFPRVDGQPFPAQLVAELGLGRRDLGIDGICKREDEDLVAIQVKFRANRESLTYRELATFWSEAERAAYRLVFTNTANVSDVALRRRGHLQVSREQLDALDADFFRALRDFAAAIRTQAVPARKEPRPYQLTAMNDVVAGFAAESRGKLIAACGIGKTLLGLWIAERINAGLTLFVAPNLYLIRQTLNEWALQSSSPLEFIVVCSDQTVASDLDEISDETYGSDIPITTDVGDVAEFLASPHQGRAVVLSTYQSLEVVANAVGAVADVEFDLALFDEAHKTAGLDTEGGFGIGLYDEHIPARRRLFMTATERLFSPRLQAAAINRSRLVFSMDNRELYGPVFHRLNFSDAIAQGIISDYRIVIAILSGDELRNVVASNALVIDPNDPSRIQTVQRTEQILNFVMLEKVVSDLGPRKLVSYHSTVSLARSFARLLNERLETGDGEIEGFSVDGTMRSSARHQQIRSFEESDVGVLTNARCLIEGVDIPLIDGVFFASPKRALVDIVQAVGRALRKRFDADDEKIAYVVIPIVTDPDSEIDVSHSAFDRLYDVVQALRDQDQGVADQIDRMNLVLSTTRRLPPRETLESITLVVPGLLDVGALREQLMLRIAEVNARPTGVRFYSSDLGQGERGSDRPRSLRTMGDYTVARFQSSLVDPTLAGMLPGQSYPRSSIQSNNNNVSHSERLGVIVEGDEGFSMTHVGFTYKLGDVGFDDLFRNQMMLYRDKQHEAKVYPYRLLMSFVQSVGNLTYWDFLFGVYAIDPVLDLNSELEEAVQRVELVRSSAIRADLANEPAKQAIADQLTELTGIEYAFTDIWTDRTTTFNQFRYFRRHLELFEDVFGSDGNTLILTDVGRPRIDELLSRSESMLGDDHFGLAWWYA